MSYFAPFVDESGLHYPNYDDILSDLIDRMQAIFGVGIYLGNDSPDYEMLSMFALKIYDTYQALEIAYDAHSPVTAFGTGLDYVVAINGLKRKSGSNSRAVLDLAGTPGTQISGGMVSDDSGYLWDIPETVTIGDDGHASADAVCRQPGVVHAAEDTITTIMTPTRGWTSVTNPSEATVGVLVEADSALRARQAQSVAQPSRGLLKALKGGLQAVADVNRCEVHENDTGAVNSLGIPAHSICAVVEGGDDSAIAETIQKLKAPGCGTYGSQTVTVTDADGGENEISFSRLTYVPVDVQINLTARAGYSASMSTEIKAAIVQYLSEFSIGMDLTPSILWMVAQQVNEDVRSPAFAITSVKAARHGGTLSTGDVSIAYNEVAQGNAAYITINVS